MKKTYLMRNTDIIKDLHPSVQKAAQEFIDELHDFNMKVEITEPTLYSVKFACKNCTLTELRQITARHGIKIRDRAILDFI